MGNVTAFVPFFYIGGTTIALIGAAANPEPHKYGERYDRKLRVGCGVVAAIGLLALACLIHH